MIWPHSPLKKAPRPAAGRSTVEHAAGITGAGPVPAHSRSVRGSHRRATITDMTAGGAHAGGDLAGRDECT